MHVKIFKLKKRPKNNPLIVHYYNEKDLKDCNFNDTFQKLYTKFCPGPITFILNLKKTSKISKVATNQKKFCKIPKTSCHTKIIKKITFSFSCT